MEGEFEERVFANKIDLINEALAWSLTLFIGLLVGLLLYWTMEPGWVYLAIVLSLTLFISIILWWKWFHGIPSHVGLSRNSVDIYLGSRKHFQISWDDLQRVKMVVEEEPGVLLDPLLVAMVHKRKMKQRAKLYLKDGRMYEITGQIGEALQKAHYSLTGRWAL